MMDFSVLINGRSAQFYGWTVSRHKDSCKYSWDLARTARGQVQAE